MGSVHMAVGTLVLLGYLALTISYFRAMQGKPPTYLRQLSMGAGAVILVQWVLGFGLLAFGDDHPNALHYLFALATILTVGFEHSVAVPEKDALRRGRLGAIAAGLTFVLALVAYAIGESTS